MTKNNELIIQEDSIDPKVDQELIKAASDYFKKDLVDNSPEGVSSDAVVLNKDGTAKLDENQIPIFKDSIEWPTNNPQLRAICESIMALVGEGLVPPLEIDATFGLLTRIAKFEKPGHTGDFTVEIPINYFVGMIHILNMCIATGIYLDDQAMESAIKDLSLDLARRVDAYHAIKNREKVMETPPEEIKKELKAVKGKGKEYF